MGYPGSRNPLSTSNKCAATALTSTVIALLFILDHYLLPGIQQRMEILLSPPFVANIFVEGFSVLFICWSHMNFLWGFGLFFFPPCIAPWRLCNPSEWSAFSSNDHKLSSLTVAKCLYSSRLLFFPTDWFFSTWGQPVPPLLRVPSWIVSSVLGLLGPSRLPSKALTLHSPKRSKVLSAGSPRWQFCLLPQLLRTLLIPSHCAQDDSQSSHHPQVLVNLCLPFKSSVSVFQGQLGRWGVTEDTHLRHLLSQAGTCCCCLLSSESLHLVRQWKER